MAKVCSNSRQFVRLSKSRADPGAAEQCPAPAVGCLEFSDGCA
jgi:hypothetical protein